MINPVIFAGAGPGDPDLITVKAQKALMDADLIVYTGSLVPDAVLNWAKPEATIVNSASMILEEIINILESAHKDGKRVVRLHTGDPSLYGAIYEQITELDKRSISYRIIPGVTAAFAAAAAMGVEYTIPEISQTLILTRMAGRTPVPESESIESLAKHKTSMAIYLSINLVEELERILIGSYGKDALCAIAFKVSQPDEKIICTRLDELKKTVLEENISSQALIIVGKFLNLGPEKSEYKSRLYSGNFSHGYRSVTTEVDRLKG